MEITPVGSSLASSALSTSSLASAKTTETQGDSFQSILGDAVNELNNLQLNANQAISSLAAGDDVDIHNVMIATEEADVGMQLAMQVRNKIVDAYQEVMRMSV